MKDWYKEEIVSVLKELGTNSSSGLSESEAESRLGQYGRNELVEKGVKSIWKILLEQLSGIMVIILIIAAVISFLLGETSDATVILIIIVLNAVLGVSQEFKAEKAIAALKRLAVPNVKVRREGGIREVSARDIVPGDIVILEAGYSVPADCRITESVNLRIQESALTGESEAVEKSVPAIPGRDSGIGDRRNMAFMGTFATYGRGQAVVTDTGMRTELGKIASMIQSTGNEPTPLQKRLDQLGKGLAVAALGVIAVVFIFGLVRSGTGMENIRLMFLTAVSMAVAAVPEGLPAIVTIALALGAQRMLKRRALIRKLMAVETLGSVTVICSDKTGTLTENRMTVTILDVAGHRIDIGEWQDKDRVSIGDKSEAPLFAAMDAELDPAMKLLLTGGSLCNDASLSKMDGAKITALGDPTEAAIVVAAARYGIMKDAIDTAFPRVSEFPFDSDRKRMSTIHRIDGSDTSLSGILKQAAAGQGEGGLVVFTKGAIDGLIQISSDVFVNGKVQKIDEAWTGRVLAANESMAANGVRVLGLAYKRISDKELSAGMSGVESGMTIVGLLGMIDPPRQEVLDAVKKCDTAGIRPLMITGDHPLTALYIAKQLGIAHNERMITGRELDTMTEDELEKIVEEVSVYARVSPEHKVKIVAALKKRGHVVAMTGDGINDAPALKKADIGVAMGITGTDVSKEASDMVLQDDNFATIVAAVEEGRIIYDNIRKFIKYLMTSNAGEIWVMLVAPFLGMPLPLLPLQILWINLVTDGLPGLALGVEPAEKNIMRRKPYDPKENIFGRGMGIHIVWVGLFMAFVTLATGFAYWTAGNHAWQTMAFCVLTFGQMFHVMAVRTGNESLFKAGLLSNKAMLGAVGLTFALQFVLVYTPFLNKIFEVDALSPIDMLASIAIASSVFVAVEIEKAVRRRKERNA